MTRYLIALATLSLALVSCNKIKKTPGGLEYKIFTSNSGTKAEAGDYVFFKVVGKAGDSVLYNTYKNPHNPNMAMLINEHFEKGNFEEGLTLLAAGDSAMFLINADSFFRVNVRTEAPAFIKKGSNIEFTIKVDSIITKKTMEERKAQHDLEMAEKQKNEASTMEEYIKNAGLKFTKTESGIYYVITKSTTGAKAAKGDMISANYTGKLLSGKVFDSNDKTGKPFEFELGAQQVIMGWDEIFGMLHQGEKATIVLPSNLAYGAQGAGPDIEPFTPLMFDVELVGITKAKK